MQLLYNFICRHIACIIKVSELNTPSYGNGIAGIRSVFFFNEMGNKKKKNGN